MLILSILAAAFAGIRPVSKVLLLIVTGLFPKKGWKTRKDI